MIYFAISTENAGMCGMTILAIAGRRDIAEKRGRAVLPAGMDFRAVAWQRNFEVVSETQGRRRGLINDHTIDQFMSAEVSR